MKKETVATVLLKGAIIGLGTLGGFVVSKLFKFTGDEEPDAEPSIADTAVDVPFQEVSSETSSET